MDDSIIRMECNLIGLRHENGLRRSELHIVERVHGVIVTVLLLIVKRESALIHSQWTEVCALVLVVVLVDDVEFLFTFWSR